MRRVTSTARAGAWPAGDAADKVTLGFEDRVRRRMRLVGESGDAFLLDLPAVVRLGDGDGLHLDDGNWIAVRAAPEPVVEVLCATPEELARIAWHLGNRHVPAQLMIHGVRFRDDPVIVDMVRGLGAKPVRLQAPFQPEPGAYHRHEQHGHHHG
jgi:urease accessory protein